MNSVAMLALYIKNRMKCKIFLIYLAREKTSGAGPWEKTAYRKTAVPARAFCSEKTLPSFGLSARFWLVLKTGLYFPFCSFFNFFENFFFDTLFFFLKKLVNLLEFCHKSCLVT